MKSEGEKMGERSLEYLYKVAITGKKEDLPEAEYTGALDRVSKRAKGDNPLHIAAVFGHLDIVKEILQKKPKLAGKVNRQGLSPLHLASENGHVAVVKELLETALDVCFVRDDKGETPLHLAAIKGQLEVVEVIVKKINIAAWMLTENRKPILHLCARFRQFEVLKKLLELVDDEHFANLKDSDGNTILHVLTVMEEFKVIKFLFDTCKGRLDVNAKNVVGLTALDLSYQCPGTFNPMRIRSLLLRHGAKHERKDQLKKLLQNLRRRSENNEGSKTREALMVVAILIATVTFTAQMSPPGGVFQEDGVHNKTEPYTDPKTKMLVYTESHLAGKAVMGYKYPNQYIYFTAFNTIGFLASLMMILVLATGCSLRQHFWKRFMRVITCIAAASMLVAYGCSFSTTAPPDMRQRFYVTGIPITIGGLAVLASVALPVVWYVCLSWAWPPMASSVNLARPRCCCLV